MQQTTQQQQQQQSNTGEKRKRKRKTDNSSMPIPSSPTLNDLTPNNSKNLKYDISSGSSTAKKNILDLYSRVSLSISSLTYSLTINL
jgi:hypothetical protein